MTCTRKDLDMQERRGESCRQANGPNSRNRCPDFGSGRDAHDREAAWLKGWDAEDARRKRA